MATAIASERVPVSSRAAQAGIALITVLLLLVFVMMIVGGLFYRHQIHIQKVSRLLIGEQAVIVLIGAESWARRVLEEDASNTGIDHLGERWAKTLPTMPVEGGSISGCIRDEQSLFSLNSLGSYTSKTWSDEVDGARQGLRRVTRRVIFRNLLDQAGLDSSDDKVASLVDWIDADSWLVSPTSAEDNEYLLQNPPYRAANHPIGDITELTMVQGYNNDDVVRLDPYVNTVPDAVALNVNTAQPSLLSALTPEISVDLAQRIIEERPFENLDEFYQHIAVILSLTESSLRNMIPAQLLAIDSDYFSVHLELSLAGSRYSYSGRIARMGGRTRVLARTITPVPEMVSSDQETFASTWPCRAIS